MNPRTSLPLLAALFLRAALLVTFGVLFIQPCAWSRGGASAEDEAAYISAQRLTAYDGKEIARIDVLGLVRTSERAVRLLLGGREGESFDADRWAYGVRKLYNTQDVYEIGTEVTELEDHKLHVKVTLRDKWTLVPNVYFQGGGGTFLLGGGVIDTNVGGYFTQVALGAASLSGAYFYDINLFQEFFLDTELMMGLDISRAGFPSAFQDTSGNVAFNLTWARTQQQILFGTRIGRNLRLFAYFEHYQDTMLSADSNRPANANVFTQDQYRIRPTLVIGRSNLTNFLEEGQEITIAPTSANFFSGNQGYHQLVANYKRTVILPANANLALWASGGLMTAAPLPYEFRLGGFDSVRGYGSNRAIGNLYFDGSIEYRPSLFSTKLPIAELVVLQGALFSDAGWIKSDDGSVSQGLFSAGVGFRVIFAHFSNCILRFDVARTIAPFEGYDFSFSLGQFF